MLYYLLEGIGNPVVRFVYGGYVGGYRRDVARPRQLQISAPCYPPQLTFIFELSILLESGNSSFSG